MFNTNAQCYQNVSEYIRSLADVNFHIVASMYVRFRYSDKNPMRFAVFGVFQSGFAVFGPPLRPPPIDDCSG